ncbi:hypothetical protein B9J07_27965 [Sinorhizobium sp. LM21]|uniref:hypothetical protein n=1 Tax=Sinorhizobium sp. LM21 TaxID=1449788 RepID=UPI0005DA389E|nr:hypothetical protein [Sinorhizobium sp. LM21]AJW30171.1 hypothetical protein pLM21S1_p51 [Sinorhizobium sp. LM21]OWZ90426.1 hypothetical protein B9J07_27965 [Sinorhizobium sp. LM21]
MNLYFINGSDNDGNSMDLFVRAATPQEAFDLWKNSDVGAGWTCCFEGVLSPEPAVNADEYDLRIFEVSVTREPGILGWHTTNGVNVVAHAHPI